MRLWASVTSALRMCHSVSGSGQSHCPDPSVRVSGPEAPARPEGQSSREAQAVDTVHDSGRRSTFLCVPLDMGIGPSSGAIVDCPHFVPLIFFFARVRTPCGRCAQVIMRRMETLHIGKGSKPKTKRTNTKQPPNNQQTPTQNKNTRGPQQPMWAEFRTVLG